MEADRQALLLAFDQVEKAMSSSCTSQELRECCRELVRYAGVV